MVGELVQMSPWIDAGEFHPRWGINLRFDPQGRGGAGMKRKQRVRAFSDAAGYRARPSLGLPVLTRSDRKTEWLSMLMSR